MLGHSNKMYQKTDLHVGSFNPENVHHQDFKISQLQAQSSDCSHTTGDTFSVDKFRVGCFVEFPNSKGTTLISCCVLI